MIMLRNQKIKKTVLNRTSISIITSYKVSIRTRNSIKTQ